jgi:hypothetical protein
LGLPPEAYAEKHLIVRNAGASAVGVAAAFGQPASNCILAELRIFKDALAAQMVQLRRRRAETWGKTRRSCRFLENAPGPGALPGIYQNGERR